jgi:TfoX/Sxy family transcriptional regulator of competence genes
MASPHQQPDLAHFAERIRYTLIGLPLSEKRMFGGITFLHNGNMLCCASKKGLMVRVGKDAEPRALAKPTASRCTGAGRPMAGFIMVEPDGVSGDEELSTWLEMALAYVSTLPAKKEKPLIKPRKPANGKT